MPSRDRTPQPLLYRGPIWVNALSKRHDRFDTSTIAAGFLYRFGERLEVQFDVATAFESTPLPKTFQHAVCYTEYRDCPVALGEREKNTNRLCGLRATHICMMSRTIVFDS